MLSARKVSALLVCVLLLVPAIPVVENAFPLINEAEGVLKYEAYRVHVAEITHTISIRNPGKAGTTRMELWVPLIRNVTARHLVVANISSSSGTPEFLEDSSGNLYAHWTQIVIPSGQTFVAEIRYHALSFAVQFRVNSSLSKPYNTESSVYEKYTQPEKFIESDDELIVSTAKNIVAEIDEDDYHARAQAIYEFVVNYLTYRLQPKEQGALWALENKEGDCSEYSYLFVALCRAVGIPARVQAGFAFSGYTEETENGHMWAEYYLEEYGWIPVDASWKLFDKLDNRHFAALQSIPEYTEFVNYEFKYGGNTPIDNQKVKTRTASISSMENFTLAEKLFRAASKVEEAEAALFVAKIMGTWLLFPSDYRKVENAFLESQILLQNAIDSWSEQLAENAYQKANECEENAGRIALGAFAVYSAAFLVLIIIIVVLILKSKVMRREAVSP